MRVYMCVCVYVCVCVRACVRVCVRVRVDGNKWYEELVHVHVVS